MTSKLDKRCGFEYTRCGFRNTNLEAIAEMSVLKRLLSSALRVKVLSHFFLRTEESVYVRQLAGFLRESPGTVARELTNLEKAGVLRSE